MNYKNVLTLWVAGFIIKRKEVNPMYTLQKAAKEIGIQVRTARQWLKTGKMSAVQNENRRWSVSEEEVERLKNGYENRKHS